MDFRKFYNYFAFASIVYHTGALIANIGREKTVKTGIRSQAMRGFRSDHDLVRSSPEITRRSARVISVSPRLIMRLLRSSGKSSTALLHTSSGIPQSATCRAASSS